MPWWGQLTVAVLCCIPAILHTAPAGLRLPRFKRDKYNCDKNKHQWDRVEREPGARHEWVQTRNCLRCNIKHVRMDGGWMPAIGGRIR